ncbi:MAG: STAS domain-containing protein [Endozoicomonadaceae bacterium]|nr:STAS domain-containing protein [Endozoicomonadaceae bacterium]
MNFNHSKQNQFTVVKIDENRLDASQANAFKDYMLGLLNSGEDKIILDLSKINFMDSSGLGAVVAVRKELMSKDDSKMHLANPQSAINDLLDLTCMNKVFSIFSSVEDALKNG